ncbi:SDR family oxidoreductase [Schlesneria paludicola]|uniref:SDR family oxidoreductase n=1 Tax=Schlesneria paludicola TaxID=360056 RepID=UPI00029B3622|nr:SDR family oxidoreductase [Schlesneria paludicola]
MTFRPFADADNGPSAAESSLVGQVAVVIGGTSGIGRALSYVLSQRGCRVYAASRSGGRSASTTQVDMDNRSQREPDVPMITELTCDVANRSDVDRLFQNIVHSQGTLDIVVNSAGIGRGTHSRNAVAAAMHLEESEWQEVCDTNIRGMFLVARAAAGYMIPQGRGQIVNISSARSARRGQPFASAYSATKMAALAMVQALGEELAPYGIRAWSMLPDAVATDLIAKTNLAKRGAMNPIHLGHAIADLLSLPFDARWTEPLLAPFGSESLPHSTGVMS